MAMAMAMEEKEIMGGLPPGFIFRPHQRDLVEYYLLRKVTGNPLPSNNPVKDIDVYGDPKVWTKLFHSSGIQTLYCYTKLTKKKEKGKRVVRATEFGTWRAQKDVKVYDHSDEDDEEVRDGDGFNHKEQRHIGSKRTFTFVAKKGLFPNARWTMHEYRLDGIYANTTNNDDFVLCQINKFKKQRGFARDNLHQEEGIATSKNLELPSLISEETNTPQTEVTIETPHLNFSDIDWTEVISMDSASHDVSPLNMEQEEDLEAWCNSLFT
ncbi:NAC domain-containing protein 1-like [Castanea sativa]|uniref:NAC domain-containing protein 1-like n=1 Tax=Castanea sativa TaxID=21020 RepID=UPI003F64D33C